MNAEADGAGESERRLHRAVAACLEAVEAGAGPHLEQVLRQYPEFAAELAEFFTGREQLERLAAPLREIADLPSAGAVPEGPPPRLGEYRILREVGRGGMGVVYEAVQESLGRHVALKVLPGHALLSAEYRERFRRESRAAALLHHSNIVPVFGVGQDGGVEFYAMQFIHGQSLDRVLRELRRSGAGVAALDRAGTAVPGPPEPGADLSASLADALRTGRLLEKGGPVLDDGPADPSATAAGDDTQPSGLAGPDRSGGRGEYFRGVARIGVQVAEALAYAHRQGILHRDIKPSNLLLDAQGAVWVTDFGLAKTEGGVELTRSGDVVGTLRYLAPERFDGRSDPRGDVYSLGATLYELLTLRPPFDEPDWARLVERVTHGEPPRPRQLDGRIPRDLETVVLKALARDPSGRYPTAEALAEDLRRFLLDRPIQARRAGPPERAWRWCRRNPVVAGLLNTAVVLAAGLAVLALLLWDKQKQTEAALKQGEEERQEADRRRQTAETNFRQAYVLLNNQALLNHLEWLDKGGSGKARQEALERAIAMYQGYLKEPGSDPAGRMLTGRVYTQLAEVQLALEQRAEAVQSYQKAIALLEGLVAEFPREAGFRHSLADCYGYVGWLRGDPAHPEESIEAHGKAISLYEGLRDEFPEVALYTRSLGRAWNSLAECQRCSGQFRRAEEAQRRALALHQEVFDRLPGETEQKRVLAESLNNLAWILVTRPDRQPSHAAEALGHARKAVELDPEYDDRWHTLGVAHCRMGQWKEALAAIEKSRQLSRASGPPGSFDRFFEAMIYSRLGDREKARRCYDEGVRWMEKNAPEHPDLRRFRAEADAVLGIEARE